MLLFACSGSPDSQDIDRDGFAADDCNDDNRQVFPGAIEHCNGKDDDCAGSVDEGFDRDDDGFLVDDAACRALRPVDCDDDDAAVHPDASERCNGVDANRDGVVDEAEDADNDSSDACSDCDDADNGASPLQTEISDAVLGDAGLPADPKRLYAGGSVPRHAVQISFPPFDFVTSQPRVQLHQIVRHWNRVHKAFQIRNGPIHGGQGTIGREFARRHVQAILEATAQLDAFAGEHGVNLSQKMKGRLRARPRSLVDECFL